METHALKAYVSESIVKCILAVYILAVPLVFRYRYNIYQVTMIYIVMIMFQMRLLSH